MSILIRAWPPRCGLGARPDRLCILGRQPHVWLERLRSPLLVEALEIVYAGFVPAVLMVALCYGKNKLREFRYYAFLIALGLLNLLRRILPGSSPGTSFCAPSAANL